MGLFKKAGKSAAVVGTAKVVVGALSKRLASRHQEKAGTAGAQLVREQAGGRAAGGPARAVIDSRAVQPGDLFFGLPGENVDGGAFAAAALDARATCLRERAYALAGDADHVEERIALRGQVAELTVRAANTLVVARGGSGMLSASPEQRWSREATFHLVQAQTDAVRSAQLDAFTGTLGT